MNVQIGWWAVPLLMTVITWAWALLRPTREDAYGFDIGYMISLFMAIVMTLGYWLAYFIVF